MYKFRLLITILAIFFIANVYSQEVSKIKPTNIVWVADGDTISIETAKVSGIPVPQKLEIVVFPDTKTIGKFNNQKLEFRWYKQGPTRLVITNSFTREINVSNSNVDYKISTERFGLRKGWWKVQVESYVDRKLLTYKDQQEFWINLK